MGVKLAVIITGILLCSLLVTTYRYHDSMLRVQNKTLASIGFVLVGAFAWTNQLGKGRWQEGALILLALIASLVGDMMLGMADYNKICTRNRYFVAGIIWFGVALGFYARVFGQLVGWHLTDLWLPIGVVFVSAIAMKLPCFDFKRCNLLVLPYAFILILMFEKAIDLGLSGIMEAYAYKMIWASALFVFSDFLLIFKYFYKKPKVWMTMMNLTCYYIAQVLFAIGILYL